MAITSTKVKFPLGDSNKMGSQTDVHDVQDVAGLPKFLKTLALCCVLALKTSLLLLQVSQCESWDSVSHSPHLIMGERLKREAKKIGQFSLQN